MLWLAMADEEFGQDVQHILAVQFAAHINGEAFTCILVNNRQHSEGTAIVGAIRNEVVGPNIVPDSWPQPDTRPIIQPQPATFRLLLRYFQPFTTPDPLHPGQAHPPTLLSEKPVDTSVTIAAVA